MANAATKKGAVGAAPELDCEARPNTTAIAIPARYSKRIAFSLEGQIVRFKGGRAYLLDLLLDAQPAGVDRSATWPWCANLGDTVMGLRAKGLTIKCSNGTYTLASPVRRFGGGQ